MTDYLDSFINVLELIVILVVMEFAAMIILVIGGVNTILLTRVFVVSLATFIIIVCVAYLKLKYGD